MKTNLRWVMCLSLQLCLLLSGAMAQTVSSKVSKPVSGKTTSSSSAKRNADLAAREKAKKDSAEAVLTLAKQIAREFIAADSAKKAKAIEDAVLRQAKYDEMHKDPNEGLSKKELKKIEKEEKLAEEKRKKELKEEEKAEAKGKVSKSGKASKTMQTYAILPFDVKIEKNMQMKKTTPEMLHEQETSEASLYQNGVYQFLMKRKKDYAVNFQDIDDTNTLLSRAGVSGANLKDKTKSELCELLNVDGIVNGKFYRKEAMDQTVGKALNMATARMMSVPVIKTGDADLSLTLYNTAEKRVTWTYRNDDWNGMKDQNDITERLMQKAAKKFPFKK